MRMWSWLPIADFIRIQRERALEVAIAEARELQREGYGVDADRVLDAAIDRRRAWEKP